MKILWIPHTAWHIPQRAHFFCRALSERHTVHVTDWVADFTRLPDFFSRRYFQNFTYRQYMDGRIQVHGIPRITPALFFPWLRRLNAAIFARSVERIIHRFDIDVVVGTFVCPPPRAPRLVFDLFDENVDYWMNYRRIPGYAHEIAETENAYLARADAVVAISSVLADQARSRRKAPKNGNVFLIPNAVNLEQYRNADQVRVREKLGLGSRRVIGMVSAMGEFSGLLRLVEAFRLLNAPETALLIVGDGPLLEPAMRIAGEYGLQNVHFTGKVPANEVQDYYMALDVGVIPFDKTAFTDAACPIKLLEYTAAGKVVVSTDLEEVRRMNFPNVILVEPTSTALSEGLHQAMAMQPMRPAIIEEYALEKLVMQYEAVLQGGSF